MIYLILLDKADRAGKIAKMSFFWFANLQKVVKS